MSDYNIGKPAFSLSLLHPKYWGVWFGFGLLALIVNILPYSLSLKLGQSLGKFAMNRKIGQKRLRIARRNLELAFPDKPKDEIETLLVENFKNAGAALIESGMAWFWPSWRFRRLLINKDTSKLIEHANNNRGVLLCAVHAFNLEVCARGFAALGMPGYGVYRPHSNAAYEFIQYRGRSRDGNKLVYRRDLKKMIRVLRQGDRLFYLPDQDYGHNKSVFVPFFAVEDACTTTGTSILAYASKCAVVPVSGFRNQDGKYEIMADVSIENDYPQHDKTAAAAYVNKYMEEVILRAPEQWMWLHKRFKSLPDGTQSNARYQ